MSLIDAQDARSSDGIGSLGSFYEFIQKESEAGRPRLEVCRLDSIIKRSADPQDLARWVGRCLVFDSFTGREAFIETLNQLDDSFRGTQILDVWARAADYIHDELFPGPSTRSSFWGTSWRDSVDVAELARVLLTFEKHTMMKAAELYFSHLAPKLSQKPDVHGDLLRAIHDLPIDHWMVTDSVAPDVFRILGHLWFDLDLEARIAVLQSCQWATGWLLPESRIQVLKAMSRVFEDSGGRRKSPAEPPSSLVRVAALYALVPTDLIVDFAKDEAARPQATDLDDTAARAEALIYPLLENTYLQRWREEPEELWEAATRDGQLSSLLDLEQDLRGIRPAGANEDG